MLKGNISKKENKNVTNFMHHSGNQVWESDKSIEKNNREMKYFHLTSFRMISVVILHPVTCRGIHEFLNCLI